MSRFRSSSKPRLMWAILTISVVTAAAWFAARSVMPGPLPPIGDGMTWRTRSNDGANCLGLQLRTIGRPVSHQVLLAELAKTPSRDSLAALAALGRRHGAGLSPKRLTFEQLATLPTPATVLLEPAGSGSGTFVLVTTVTPENVTYVEGASVTWVQSTSDDFRRVWSGHALVSEAGGWFRMPGFVGGLVLCPALVYFLVRTTLLRRHHWTYGT